ncbi:MAG TPA: IS1 family transposase [Anaerolineales bacterium]|nr:IS1 family transposase [Anaerolineales bacterium]
MKCPYCEKTERQNKVGKTVAGSQRYKCMYCQRKYTPNPKPRGYPPELRQKALQMYVDGLNYRRVARHLNISHQTVYDWVRQSAERLPPPPQPEEVSTVELDEMYSFVGNKKTGSTS